MPVRAIVSYDASPPDRDALALAALLRDAGAELTLAYVRHAGETRADRELIADVAAEGRLREGALRLREPDCAMRVVSSPSTARGLGELAGALGAEVIVFGSEARIAPGRVGPGRAALALMENGPAALALAPAGLAAGPATELRRIGILPGTADEAAIETAVRLADCHGAQVTDVIRDADLVVVGSRPHAREGCVLVSASAAAAIEGARVPVLVTARGVALGFQALVTV